MLSYLYIATATGLFAATLTGGSWTVVGHMLPGKPLTSLSASEDTLLAGTADGVWRSWDNGKSWRRDDQGLDVRHVRWLTHVSELQTVFLAGTEPAGIFVTHDRGTTWRRSPEVGKMRDAKGWFLPYSPAAGCVRGFAGTNAREGQVRIYAAVEVGGALISEDGGRTWHLAEGSDGLPDIHRELGRLIHPDVHSITVQPDNPDLVAAATGGGLYRSSDGGRNWENIYRCYIRAVWVDPEDPDHIVAGPADGVSRRGRIEVTTDGGRNWQPASDGMPPIPWPRHMVERFARYESHLFAVLSNGELWASPVHAMTWQRVLPEIPRVTAVAGNRG